MNTELKPTYENIIETIKTDVLGRNVKIKEFVKILFAISDTNIISLDGDWGTGKTFFVKQVIETLKCLCIEDYTVHPDIQQFVDNLKKDFEDIDTLNQVYPIYFNSWEYDSNEDPLLTIIYSIIEQNPMLKDFSNVSESIKEKIIRIISSFKVGLSYSDESGKSVGLEVQCDPKRKQKITEDVISIESLKETFRELLEELKIGKSNKLIIFIDELDRCNPNFAVKLLERVKHFFNDEEYIFVFSTNILQLQHTIKKFYGEGLDGYSYLDKFFDLSFTLPTINIQDYINSLKLVNLNSSDYIDISIKEITKILNFTLRKCNRYIKLISLSYNSMNINSSNVLGKNILFPILLAIKIDNIDIYNKIATGNGEEELKAIILKSEELVEVFNNYFRVDISEKEFKFDFNDFYKSIFVDKDGIGYSSVKIGNRSFEYVQNRKIMFEMLSFLNGFNSF